MVQVLDLKNPWSRGIEKFYESFTPNYMDQLSSKKEGDVLQRLMSGNMSPEEQVAMMGQANLSSASRSKVMDTINMVQNIKLKREEAARAQAKEAKADQAATQENQLMQQLFGFGGDSPANQQGNIPQQAGGSPLPTLGSPVQQSYQPMIQQEQPQQADPMMQAHEMMARMFSNQSQQQMQPQPQQMPVQQAPIAEALQAQETPQQRGNFFKLADDQLVGLVARGGNLAQAAKAELTRRDKEKETGPETKRINKLAEKQAESDLDYNERINKQQKTVAEKSYIIDRIDQINKTGASGKAYEKLLEKLGFSGQTSEGRREMESLRKYLMTDAKEILGSQFSTFEFQTILNASPGADFSPAANKAIIASWRDLADIKKQEAKIAREVKAKNKGKIPEDFESLVADKLLPYVEKKSEKLRENARVVMNEQYKVPQGKTLMFDPQGNPLHISPDEIEHYKQFGATIP